MSVRFFDDATIARLVGYSSEVDDLTSPDAVLDRLHDITAISSINVQGANRFSVKVGDWRQFEIGKSIFIHRCVPQGFVEEWAAFVSSGLPIGLMTARMCLAPFTWAELFKRHDLTGSERRTFELGQKYGMRDGFWCPIGGRWAVMFWSPRLLGESFTQQARGLLYMAAGAAATRMERLVGPEVKRLGERARLTLMERSVLQHAAAGDTTEETATVLGIGAETVRTHHKKAQAKLGTSNRTHTVSEALRAHLVV